MNSAKRAPAGLSSLRSCVTWLFVIMLTVYVLYSSNVVFHNRNHHQHECSFPSSDLSTKENLEDAPPLLGNNNNKNNKNNHNNHNNNNNNNNNSLATADVHLESATRLAFRDDTELNHIVFCIAASANFWDKRKEYIKTWWRPGETRGVVWLDKQVKATGNEGLPEIKISGNTSGFEYTNRQGTRSALRISRVVSETLRLGMEDVRWFVMGDDDTVFLVENVLRVLSKYDNNQYYYIGSSSESHIQNIFFSYSMAYGGGGFAISYPLAKELEKVQDRCIQRYPGLYGSDDRIQACMAELGVPLTKEPGFHQYDVYGNLLGLLGAHPVSPLVSLHHLDLVDPIFPELSRVKSLERLFESAKQDSASVIQQSICYDKKRYWSISLSWGYVVQIIRGNISPRELEMPTRTFLNWYKKADYTAYAFNTRPVTKHPCQKPFLFYLSSTRYDRGRRQIIGIYSLHRESHPYCRWKMDSPEKISSIVVLKRPDSSRWQKSPRRDCCRILPSKRTTNIYIWVGNCRAGEISEL